MANLPTGGRGSPLAWVLFSLKGRVSRHVYWLSFVLFVSLNGVLIGQLFGGDDASFSRVAEVAGPFVLLGTIYSNLAVTVKRLHDVGYSGLLALAMFVPLVNLFFTIWIGILPGTSGPNAYGEAPDRLPA